MSLAIASTILSASAMMERLRHTKIKRGLQQTKVLRRESNRQQR
ncbi:MAG TPA: hypothetical protein V6D26_15830 [Stenomitos sp.]